MRERELRYVRTARDRDNTVPAIVLAQVPIEHSTSLAQALKWIAEHATEGDVLRWPRIGPKRLEHVRFHLLNHRLNFKGSRPASAPLTPEEKRERRRANRAWQLEMMRARQKLDAIEELHEKIDKRIMRLRAMETDAPITCEGCGESFLLADMAKRHAPEPAENRSPEQKAAAVYGLLRDCLGAEHGACSKCNQLAPHETCSRCGIALTTRNVEALTVAVASLRASGPSKDEEAEHLDTWLEEGMSGLCVECEGMRPP